MQFDVYIGLAVSSVGCRIVDVSDHYLLSNWDTIHTFYKLGKLAFHVLLVTCARSAVVNFCGGLRGSAIAFKWENRGKFLLLSFLLHCRVLQR